MPIYDYQCSHCGFKQEVMRKLSDPTLSTCPQCQQNTFSKLLSAPSFQLTGSGWYATDFKDSKKPSVSKPSDNPTVESAPASCAPGCGCH